MEGVGAVVFRDVVSLAVESKFGPSDAAGVAADEGAEVGAGVLKIAIEGVKAENDVGNGAALVGRPERDEDSAIVGDACFHASLVDEGVEVGGASFRHLAEVSLCDGGVQCEESGQNNGAGYQPGCFPRRRFA